MMHRLQIKTLIVALFGAAAILFACAGVAVAQSTGPESTESESNEATRSGSQKNAGSRDLDPQRAAEEEEEDAKATSEDLSSLSEGDTVPDRYIVVLKDDAQAESGASSSARENSAQIASEMAQEHSLDVRRSYHTALKGFSARIPEKKVDKVRSDERVEFVDEVTVVEASRKKKKKKKKRPVPVPITQVTPTGIQRTGALSSTTANINYGDDRVNADIAILDTGVYPHYDLNLAGGVDCSNDGQPNNFSDGNGHGTHVAGSAAALDNTFGVVGVAPGARVWAIKVLSDAGTGTNEDVICGIDTVAANSSLLEVANMSLGGGGADDGNCGNTNNDAEHRAICNAVNTKGVPFVVAAGNESDDLKNHRPAAYNEVITVTNLADYDGKPGNDGLPTSNCNGPDDDDDYRYSSNFATLTADKAHTIAAPGTCILSTWYGGYIFNTISGTSMASPHVAGAAALIKAKNPSFTPAQVMSTLLNTSNSEPFDDAIPTSTHSRWQWRSGFGYDQLHDERMMLANNF